MNRFRDPASVGTAPDPAIREYQRSLPGYQPTPLRHLAALARSLGVGSVMVKDESSRLGLPAFKVMGAAWAVHALASRDPGLGTVATATDGNHGRAVAWAARARGLRAVIYIPAHSASARVEAIRGEGADVVRVEGTYDEAVAHCASDSEVNGWAVVADVGYGGYEEIPRWIAAGYDTIFQEVDDALGGVSTDQPTHILIQGGVGGLAGAAINHYRRGAGDPRLAIVEPTDADCLFVSASSPDGRPTESPGAQRSIMAGLNAGRVSTAAWPVVRAGADLFLTVDDDWAERAVRQLHRPLPGDPVTEAGESGAAGLAGLLALTGAPELEVARAAFQLGSDSRVLLVCSEGVTDPDGVRRILAGASHST